MMALANGGALKSFIAPSKRALIVDTGETMNAVWLPQRPGVGNDVGILVDEKAIVCSLSRQIQRQDSTTHHHPVQTWDVVFH